jgi:hypothetical protein
MPSEPARVVKRSAGMQIGTWWRAIAVGLGLAGLGAGGTAAFVTHLEAGPPSLIGMGLVLLLVGIGGRLPTRLKMGENEAAWDAVENFVERAVEDASHGDRSDLIDALGDLAEAAPQAAASGLSAIAYHKMIKEMLGTAVSRQSRASGTSYAFGFDLPRTLVGTTRGAAIDHMTRGALLVDALITGPAGTRVVVEIKAGHASAEAISQLAYWLEDTDFGDDIATNGLLITREGLTTEAKLLFLELLPRAVHVVVRGPDDAGLLIRAVAEAFSKALNVAADE